MNTSDTGEHGDYLRRLDDRADAAAVHAAEIEREESRSCKKCGERLKEPTERGVCGSCADENINGINSQVAAAEIAREEERTNPDGDAGAIALLRCLPTGELESMYRHAKADETDKGHHAACLIGRELIIRRTSNAQVAEPLQGALNDFAKVRGAL